MKLIIVESPTKAKTIQQYVNNEYKVTYSKGHVMDLPKSKFGVDIENGFTPTYVVLNEEIISEIRKLSEKAKEVIIATDPDREGEAIAYHISQLIIDKKIKRALIYEVTERGVKEALNNLGKINMALVSAQKARRVLDRIVGYKVSPLLWPIFKKFDLSAGRVQSVALRLICEREEEIKNFTPEEYWEISCKVNPSNPFIVKLMGVKIKNSDEVKKIEEELNKSKFIVSEFNIKENKRKPHPPYITSTMQQEAANKFNFSPKFTMTIAQQLFEGVKIGEKQVGLITYMRTDSLRIADYALALVRDFIKSEYGKDYLPEEPIIYGKGGAHEAIRPTDVNMEPEKIKKYLTEPQYKLYSLIWQRFLASQMSPLIYELRKIIILANKYKLVGSSEDIKFDGFNKVYKVWTKEEKVIPKFKVNDEIELIEIIKEKKYTKPKPRYTQGSIVKELEAKGIGRPSTYAPILSRIIDKNYVKIIDKHLVPTRLGIEVNKVLTKNFNDVFNVEFTKIMEENLDKIENNSADYVSIVKSFYSPFNGDVEKFIKNKEEIKKETIVTIDEKCPVCSKNKIIKWSRFGPFISCSDFPNCRYAEPLLEKTGIKCPDCGGDIIERVSKKKKRFYACANFPNCKFAIPSFPIQKECDNCGYQIMYKIGKKFICPKCKYKVTEIE